MSLAKQSWGVWVLGLALLLSTAGGAVWVVHTRAGDELPLLPDGTRPPEKQPTIDRTFDSVVCTGTNEIDGNMHNLSPATAGPIMDIFEPEGKMVKAGTPLLRIDDRLALNAVQQAEAGVKAAKIELEDAKKGPALQQIQIAAQEDRIKGMAAQMGAAQTKLDRANFMVSEKLADKSESDTAKHLLDQAKAAWDGEINALSALKLKDPANSIRRAEANLSAKEADLEKAKLALDLCTLRAPTDGEILKVNVAKGEMFGPQAQKPAIILCPDIKRIIRVNVEQEYAPRVKEGMKVIIEDDVSAPGTWRGTVRKVGKVYFHKPTVELLNFNDLRQIECIVDLDPGQTPLKIGQKVRVKMSSPGAR
jgi:multidrug resistance efflux pump